MAELKKMKGKSKKNAKPGPALPPEFWREAKVVYPDPPAKMQVTIRLDEDVVKWFKEQGQPYQPKINAVLRSFVAAQS